MTMVLGPTKNAGIKRDAETEDQLGSEEEVQGDGRRGSSCAGPRTRATTSSTSPAKQKRAFSKFRPVATANAQAR